MLDRIIKLVSAPAADGKKEKTIELAAAALLVEAALMDGHFTDDERALIMAMLQERFSLSPADAGELMTDAEKEIASSVEIYGLARTIKDGMGHTERLEMVEMLWRVVLADGRIDDYEANLMRRVAGLVYISDRENGEARQRAEKAAKKTAKKKG